MSDHQKNQGERSSETSHGTGPSHTAYTVREGKDEQSYFNRIGAAFEHKDRNGFNIQLSALPVDGRIMLRTHKARLDQQRADNAGVTQKARSDQGQERGE